MDNLLNHFEDINIQEWEKKILSTTNLSKNTLHSQKWLGQQIKKVYSTQDASQYSILNELLKKHVRTTSIETDLIGFNQLLDVSSLGSSIHEYKIGYLINDQGNHQWEIHPQKNRPSSDKHHIVKSADAIEMIVDAVSALKTSADMRVYIPSSGIFFADIALFRSIRALAMLLNLEKHVLIGYQDAPNYTNSGVDDGLIIAQTSNALSAIIGKADGYAFRVIEHEFITQIASINRIIEDEANLVLSEDPSTGSYLIESLTGEWCSKASIALDIPIPSNIKKNNPPTPWEKHHGAGMPPYIAGPYPGMYTSQPWTIRQYAGFSTAKESNAFYKNNLQQGQKGLSVAFDLPTHRGYDSDHPLVKGDVGKAGVAIDSVEDMKVLFEGIPLDTISVSMTMNGAVLPILAFYIVCAEEQSIRQEQLSGTIQNDILKEFLVRNTYIYPPEHSMNIVSHIVSYTSKHMPKFNPISISGYHMHEAGAPAEIELAYTIADGIEYIRKSIESGISIDEFAPRFSFFWGIGMNYYTEIAKLRAGRLLWAYMMRQFSPKDSKSSALRTHCQTSGWSLTAQNPFNNITRTTIEALAAVHGHTQSLHTNSLDEALALPTPFSAKIARNTQLYIQQETGSCDTIDPWAGSFLIEQKTHELALKALEYILEIEAHGGMTKAIHSGIPKRRIEEFATLKQAQIDTGNSKIVGVNHLAIGSNKELTLLEVDTKQVLSEQIKRLEHIKNTRNNAEVLIALQNLENAASSGKGNLLELSIQAARVRATLGEISFALEKVYGRYKTTLTSVSGVYTQQIHMDPLVQKARILTSSFYEAEGRRPRILVAKLGQDGHDRGAKVIAAGLSDLGFDVDLGPLFQSPKEVVLQAIDNDVHIIGISSQAGAHKELLLELVQEMEKMNFTAMIIAGGVIPPNDVEFLKNIGVHEVFGPGTVIADAAIRIVLNLSKILNLNIDINSIES